MEDCDGRADPTAPQRAVPARLAPARALDKARILPADGLIFDLEDAVAPAAKEEARAGLAAALTAGGYAPRELIVRVNPLESAWGHADLAAAATLPIDAVLLPKVESGERVRLTADLLDSLGAPPTLALWCMIETPLGVLAAAEIAARQPADCRAGPRHLRSDEGSPGARDAGPAAADDRTRPRAAGGAGRIAAASSTASISTSPTPRGSPLPAVRGATSASTARR